MRTLENIISTIKEQPDGEKYTFITESELDHLLENFKKTCHVINQEIRIDKVHNHRIVEYIFNGRIFSFHIFTNKQGKKEIIQFTTFYLWELSTARIS